MACKELCFLGNSKQSRPLGTFVRDVILKHGLIVRGVITAIFASDSSYDWPLGVLDKNVLLQISPVAGDVVTKVALFRQDCQVIGVDMSIKAGFVRQNLTAKPAIPNTLLLNCKAKNRINLLVWQF